jgi:chorismate-pyruvate lyase
VRARDSLWNTCNNLIRSAKDIWEDIFEDDDSLQFTIEMDEEESKLDSIRQQFAQRAASSSHSASDLPEENEDVGAAEYLQRLFKS